MFALLLEAGGGELLRELIGRALGDSRLMEDLCVRGYVKAKSSSVCTADKTRSVAPQPWTLKFIHLIVTAAVTPAVDDGKPTAADLYLGGGNRCAQPLDVCHGLSLAAEKG